MTCRQKKKVCVFYRKAQNKPVDWDHKAPLDKGETFIISGCTSNWTESVFQQASLSYTVLRFSVTLLIGWCIVNTAKWVPASSAMKEEQLNAVCALTVQMKKFIVISSLAVVHRAFHKWKKRLEFRLWIQQILASMPNNPHVVQHPHIQYKLPVVPVKPVRVQCVSFRPLSKGTSLQLFYQPASSWNLIGYGYSTGPESS